MNFRQLTEAGEVPNFADRAEKTLAGVGNLAKKALGKFKDAHEKERAAQDAAAQKAADKEAEDAKKADAAAKGNVAGANAPNTVADIVLSRDPLSDDHLGELEGLSPEQFNSIVNAVDKIQGRIARFPKEMAKYFRTDDFLIPSERANASARLGRQDDAYAAKAFAFVKADKFDDQAAWKIALTSDDSELVGRTMSDYLRAISREHEARNQQSTGANGKKNLAVGAALVNLLGGQRQILERRLANMKASVQDMSKKPIVTSEQIKRLGALAQLLRS